jgi:hypothetical protein
VWLRVGRVGVRGGPAATARLRSVFKADIIRPSLPAAAIILSRSIAEQSGRRAGRQGLLCRCGADVTGTGTVPALGLGVWGYVLTSTWELFGLGRDSCGPKKPRPRSGLTVSPTLLAQTQQIHVGSPASSLLTHFSSLGWPDPTIRP